MKIDSFDMGENKCCLFCDDFFVVNLDKVQFDDCIKSLQEGQPYKFKPSFWKPSTEDKIRQNTCFTFILNREFEARYRVNSNECCFSQNDKMIQFVNHEFWQFALKNLEQRGYAPFEKNLPPFRFLCESFGGIALSLLCLLMVFYSDASKSFLIFGIITGAGVLVHGLKYAKTGDTEITYYKVR